MVGPPPRTTHFTSLHFTTFNSQGKKALRTITFSQYDSPSSPYDLVTFHIATFMYKFHNQLLPTAFHSFFTKVTNIHKYNTRLAAKQSYYLPFVRTNYGKFNIRFQGPSIWKFIIWLCLTRTGNYQIRECDWLKWILTAV